MTTESKVRNLRKEMAPFEKSNTKSSIWQLVSTIGPVLLLWYAAYVSLSVSYWITLPLLILASGFVIRTFIIFHDCCHYSFFQNRKANEILGNITGVLTLVPYQQWKNSHSIHHATSSNLDKRGIGDMWVMTVEEYADASLIRRVAYRFYRNPVVMLGLGPIFVFVLSYRFNRKGAKPKERLNTYIMNVSIAILYASLCWAVGWQAFLMIQLPIIFVSGMLGIWLFYVQHQFEDSYFEHEDEWSYVKAAVEGSSYYKLPKWLQWLTGNIGFHHVHHLSPKVPNYNLEKAHNSTPPLQKATTITLLTSLASLRFRLWDEQNKVFISFKQLKSSMQQAKREKKPVPSPSPRASMQGE